MYRFFKRLLSVALVLIAVALILNLKIAGRPAREHASEIWQSGPVQKVYRAVRDRVLALIRKDISVEDVFKPEVPGGQAQTAAPKAPVPEPSEDRTINLEKLDEADRKALEKILEKSSQ